MRRLSKHTLVATALVAGLLASTARPAGATLSDCIDATCRITAADGSRGTGCVFEISDRRLFVLTNAHVVGNSPTARCEFWRQGHRSAPIEGRVIVRVDDPQCDAAILSLDRSLFGGMLPKAVPIASRDYQLASGQTITSVGCAGGAWSTGWKGHVTGGAGEELRFVPPPADGRSGSALFDATGRRIVGLLRARTLDDRIGIATSVQMLYHHLGRATAAAAGNTGGCAGGSCSDYLLPYRNRQGDPSGNPWPTMPPQPTPIDLSETNRRLDGIAALLQQMARDKSPPPVAPQVLPVPIETQRRLDDAEQTARDTQQTVGQLEEGIGGLRGLVEQVVGDRETLVERIGARIEKVKSEGADSPAAVARAYAKDLVGEKLSDGKAGMTAGKILGGALGLSGPLAIALAAGAWFVSRRIGRKIEAGDPLLVERLVNRLSDKVDDLKNRLPRE